MSNARRTRSEHLGHAQNRRFRHRQAVNRRSAPLDAGRIPEKNWSGSVRFTPRDVMAPASEEEISAVLRSARDQGRTVRVVGGGHSFTPLAASDDLMITLDRYRGLVSADPATGIVTLRGGTRLWEIADLLDDAGLALPIMGDVDVQSIAGAIQTGTHGTGGAFTGFAGMARAVRVALADGTILDATSEHEPDLFQAARLGLGTLGVICEVTMQCVPQYRLQLEEQTRSVEHSVENFLEDSDRFDHYEFFWFPGTERATVRMSTRVATTEPYQRSHPAIEYMERDLLANGVFGALCEAAAVVPPLRKPVAEVSSRLFAAAPMTDDSARVYSAPRKVRFNESEWAIPAVRFEEAFAAVQRRLAEENLSITFPIEVRRTHADDVWLSTAYGRDTVYIAAHQFHRQNAAPYLLLLQRTLEPFAARPHWAKHHWLGAKELRTLYPRFDEFTRVREVADPTGVFLTPYLRHLLGA